MDPKEIKYSKSITLEVTVADNLLVGYIEEEISSQKRNPNRRQIYGRLTDFRPTFKDSIDISSGLGDTNNNILSLTGINFNDSGHFKFTIAVDGKEPEIKVNENLEAYTSKSWAYKLVKV